jgi:hypothetical protein
VGDDPHISIVTFTTDAEDGVGYQGGGPSARRWERERRYSWASERPARRLGEPPKPSTVSVPVDCRPSRRCSGRGIASGERNGVAIGLVRMGTLRKSSVRRLALTLGTPSAFGRARTAEAPGEGRVVRPLLPRDSANRPCSGTYLIPAGRSLPFSRPLERSGASTPCRRFLGSAR